MYDPHMFKTYYVSDLKSLKLNRFLFGYVDAYLQLLVIKTPVFAQCSVQGSCNVL